ncbi:Bro-N domain-containing protein [Pseudomonas psychrophila]|uniref:BRO-N domain-containing protein n=1 Tax=Pseudomonas psychrophila TaxID=122355 RepID=UPI00382F7D12
MGIELYVLVGHPEHELLFVATQVARAAGLKNPSQSVNQFKNINANVGGLIQFRDVTAVYIKHVDTKAAAIPGNPGSSVVQANSWVGSESWVYNMLLKGHAQASEPFRKWVTEEVLPTIRKTGSYNAEAIVI